MLNLTPEQHAQLLRPLNRNRVQSRSQAGRTFSYLSQHDVRAMLIRIFGFGGFDLRTLNTQIVHQETDTNNRWHVAVMVTMELTIYPTEEFGRPAIYSETAVGESTQPRLGEALDMAVKTASSDAMKRCAINLGDGLGLSLYNDGSTDPFVKEVLVGGSQSDPRVGARVEKDGQSGWRVLAVHRVADEGVRDSIGMDRPEGEQASSDETNPQGGVRGASGSNPAGDDPRPPVLREELREPGASGSGKSRGERSKGSRPQSNGDSEPSQDPLPERTSVQSGEHLHAPEGGQVLPDMREGGDETVVSREGREGSPEELLNETLDATPIDQDTALASLRLIAPMPDAERLPALVAWQQEWNPTGVLDTMTKLQGQDITVGRLVERIMAGEFKP